MTLDEQIRRDLRSAIDNVPTGSPEGAATARRRGLRRRRAKRAVWLAATAIPLVLVLGLLLPFDPNGVDPAESHGVNTVELADLAVPVTGREAVLEDPEVWIGLPGPAPEFDTGPYGPDLSFEPGEPTEGDLDARIERAVYLGELDGEPFYLYSQPAPSFWDQLFERLDGNFSGDTLGTSLNCCSGGNMDHDGGLPGFSFMSGTDIPDRGVAEWLGLSPEVSVVAYQIDGEFVGWQTPVGGASSISLDHHPSEFVLIAFDSEGDEVGRFAPHEVDRLTPTTARDDSTAGFTSGGLEIDLEDVQSTDLREVIDLAPGETLFRVPIVGQDVYVVIGPASGHAYAESCSTLSVADIPEGLQATCLERTVDGQVEEGVFRYPDDGE